MTYAGVYTDSAHLGGTIRMTGEKNLEKLLKNLSPETRDGDYVFCTIEGASYGECSSAEPIASFLEEEGLTLVVKKETADKLDMAYEGVFKCITLNVHSSLAAVGLTAAVANALRDCGISANVIAAYYHDHVFVPLEKVNEAVAVLKMFGG